jgi:uncharacterized protein (DUF983 family)
LGDPWGSLDPSSGAESGAAPPLVPAIGGGRAIVRGLRKRCPRCGERAIFRSWLQLRDRCPRCDLRFEKEEGGFLGAMTLTYALAMAIWLAMLVAVLIATVPDVPVPPLIVASVAIMVAVPLLAYPNMKGVWAAIEYLVERSQPGYRPPVKRDPRARELE